MSVTRRAVWARFMRGDDIESLAQHFKVSIAWVESAIRKYAPRAFK